MNVNVERACRYFYEKIYQPGVGFLFNFLNLKDTPSSYSGNASKIVAVNSGADALEFKDIVVFIEDYDADNAYDHPFIHDGSDEITSHTIVQSNLGEDALEYGGHALTAEYMDKHLGGMYYYLRKESIPHIMDVYDWTTGQFFLPHMYLAGILYDPDTISSPQGLPAGVYQCNDWREAGVGNITSPGIHVINRWDTEFDANTWQLNPTTAGNEKYGSPLFAPGSQWYNTHDQELWMCIDKNYEYGQWFSVWKKITIDDASDIPTDTSNFDTLLSVADDTIQKALDTLDDISHDDLNDFVANKHIDHTNVTLTAGSGLSGGGDISANRTFNVDIDSQVNVDATVLDEILLADQSDSWNIKKTTVQKIADLATIEGTDSQILYFDGNNNPVGDSNLTWDKTNKILTNKGTVLIGGVTQTGATFDVTTNLISQWKMNDNAANTTVIDSYGSNNATMCQSVNTEDVSVAGLINSAFNLESAGGYPVAPYSADLNIKGDLTIMFRLYINNLSAATALFSFFTPGESEATNSQYYSHLGSDGKMNYVHEHGGGGANQANTFNYVWSINTWHTVFFIRDGTAKTVKLYDGTTQVGSTYTYSYAPTGGTSCVLNIGGEDSTGTKNVHGKLDDFRIWNRKLISSEMSVLYNGGAGTENNTGNALIISAVGSSATVTPNYINASDNGNFYIEKKLEVGDISYFNKMINGYAGSYIRTDQATTVGQIIKGYASQSADLIECQNSSDTVLWYIDANGNAKLNTNLKHYFRDSNIYISSKDDGHLDLDADTSIDFNAPTILDAGTAAAGTAPLKFRAGTLLATPEAGAIEYDGNKFYISNNGKQKVIDRTSDVALSTVTVANTTVETTLWTGEMSANSLDAGNIFMLHANGIISNGGSAAAADQIKIRVRVGGVEKVLLEPATKALNGDYWHIEAEACQRTIGASGSRAIHIHLQIDDIETKLVGVANIDTTANMDITITTQWGSAKTTNTISLYQGFMRYKN